MSPVYSPTWKVSRRPYICECTSRRCRTTLLLTQAEYEEFSSQGIVVSYSCARRMGKEIVAKDILSTIAVVSM